MVRSLKFLVMLMVAILSLGAVSADPITVESVNVQEVSGEYVATVLLENENTSSGVDTLLSFDVNGVVSSQYVTVDTASSTQSFELVDVLSNYDDLVVGNSYVLTVSTDNSSDSEPFVFGSISEDSGLPVSISSIKVDGSTLTDYSSVSVDNGDVLEIQISYLSQKDADNARFRAEIEGYEHSTITDATNLFSVVKGVSSSKTLTLQLPSDMESQKAYILRIYGSNDLSGLTYKEYSLYVDTQRHRVDISDLVMSPETGVEAGQAVIANVRVTNRGQKVQDSVKVVIEVPQLNIRASSYVSNLDIGEAITSEDMYLGVPTDAGAGVYTANVYTQYNDGYTQSQATFDFVVLASSNAGNDRLIISADADSKLVAGETTNVEIVVGNPSSQSKAISVVPTNMDWAAVNVNPSFGMVQPGADKSYNVKVTPYEDVRGTQTLSLLVKEDNVVVKELSIPVVFEDSKEDSKEGINWLNIVLVVLIVLLVIVLLVLLISLLRGKNTEQNNNVYVNNEEHDSADEYY